MQNDRTVNRDNNHETICRDINEIGNLLYLLAKKLNGSVYNNEFQYWEFHIYMKFLMNYCSIAHIRNGIHFPPNTNNIISDPFIFSTTIRACLETYLLYQYIFCEENEIVKEFRFLCWMREGLQTRISYSINDDLLKSTQEKDKINIEILEGRIVNNKTYQNYSAKKRCDILKGHNWRPSWNQLLKDSDLPKSYISVIYSSLSSYAHSESLSLSIINNKDYWDIVRKDEVALLPIILIMAIKVISKVKIHYNIDVIEFPKYSNIINKWQLNAVLL